MDEAMTPYGLALLDFFNGDSSAKVVAQREDGLRSDLPTSVFFRAPTEFSPLEQTALALCRGEVLDVGAGAGCHSLAIQDRGMKVWAIDISSQGVEIMSKRGVKRVQRADVFKFQAGPFDTLLLLMHGLGMVANLPGLDRFLHHAHNLVKPDGQILCDSLDVRVTTEPIHLAYQDANRQAGCYFGEIRMQFEYKGQLGPFFSWLHVDAETLAEHAKKTRWACRIVRREGNGDYLAQLTPIPKTA
jgi:SAM-dependent methyltransferase